MCVRLCVKEHRMEKDSAAATTTTKKTIWSTWEELLLAFAVKRHGLKDWESVAMELQNRVSLPALLTAQICKEKYRDLRRRFMNSYNNSYDEKIIEQDVDGNGDVTIPWIEELRKLRVAELQQEVQRYDLSIQSLELKVKKMEEEREQSLKAQSLDDGQKPDLEDVKEERSQNDKNSGADVKPEDSTGKAVSSEESDRENRSFNESNSTENRETGVKNEPEPVEIGEDKPVQEIKPVSEEDSYNDSSSDRQEEKKARRDSGDLRDTVSGSKEETRENSDVQSTATLTKRKRQRGGDGGRSGGDAAEMGSPAVGIKREGAAKSEPLVEFLDIIRSHKRGSVFKRRLDSQKTDKYKSMIRQHMDLETVQARIDDGSYCSCPSKFYLDLLLIFNNAIVYFAKSSSETTAANELRGIVMEELKKTRTQSKDLSPFKIQPKPELERSDSLLAKHKSTVPIVVCRKRSSISAKAAASSGNNKTEKPADSKPPLNPKPPAVKSSSNEEESSIKLGVKEKPVTGVRSMRRSSKGRSNNNNNNNNASQSNSNQNTTAKQSNSSGEKKEEVKPEKKKEESKKRGAAADFLKRIKKNSPTKGTLVEALKNNPPEDVVVVKGKNSKDQQKKKIDERREAPVRRSGGGGGGGGGGSGASKDEGSPSKRSVGRPPKRGGREVVVQEKRGRENSEKEDSTKRPKKRSRR